MLSIFNPKNTIFQNFKNVNYNCFSKGKTNHLMNIINMPIQRVLIIPIQKNPPETDKEMKLS